MKVSNSFAFLMYSHFFQLSNRFIRLTFDSKVQIWILCDLPIEDLLVLPHHLLPLNTCVRLVGWIICFIGRLDFPGHFHAENISLFCHVKDMSAPSSLQDFLAFLLGISPIRCSYEKASSFALTDLTRVLSSALLSSIKRVPPVAFDKGVSTCCSGLCLL